MTERKTSRMRWAERLRALAARLRGGGAVSVITPDEYDEIADWFEYDEGAIDGTDPNRIDNIPPDGFVTKLRETLGISDDATWADILTEAGMTAALAKRAATAYNEGVQSATKAR